MDILQSLLHIGPKVITIRVWSSRIWAYIEEEPLHLCVNITKFFWRSKNKLKNLNAEFSAFSCWCAWLELKIHYEFFGHKVDQERPPCSNCDTMEKRRYSLNITQTLDDDWDRSNELKHKIQIPTVMFPQGCCFS